MNKVIFIVILASVYGCKNEHGVAPRFRHFSSDKYIFDEPKDWSEDSTMTQGKIETLNEILAR